MLQNKVQMTDEKTFKGKLGNYSLVETSDGSVTLHSEFFDENFHNLKGAYEETLYTYLESTQCKRMFNTNLETQPFSLLEVGFGMGLGLYAIDRFLENQIIHHTRSNINLHFLSFEIDRELIQWQIAQDQLGQNQYSPKVFSTLSKWQLKSFYINEDEKIEYLEMTTKITDHFSFSAVLLIGDGRKVLPAWFEHCAQEKINWPKFQAIFQDAFSPKKNPDLWTVEWFSDLHKYSAKDVILSTYSSATAIRRSLFEAHWLIYNQKGFAHKKAMTIATTHLDTLGAMDSEFQQKIENTPIPAYRDQDQKEFINKRNKKMDQQ